MGIHLAAQVCERQSVGDFMLTISDALEERLDGVVDFIDGLSAIADPLDSVSGESPVVFWRLPFLLLAFCEIQT